MCSGLPCLWPVALPSVVRTALKPKFCLFYDGGFHFFFGFRLFGIFVEVSNFVQCVEREAVSMCPLKVFRAGAFVSQRMIIAESLFGWGWDLPFWNSGAVGRNVVKMPVQP